MDHCTHLLPRQDSEKKVEYLELIYDLIFVYIVGRNNSLLHAIEGGFLSAETYLTYLLSTLVILQIWYFTTVFINRYGTNGLAEHLGIFINMYLLYYMADGARVYWQEFYIRYNVAWGLILVNLGVQYLFKLRASRCLPTADTGHIRHNARMLFLQAGMIFITIPLYHFFRFPLSLIALVFGVAAPLLYRNTGSLKEVDFPHLTERVMLYVVFTFGEMIVGIASYFEVGVTPNSVYFSLMAFLIVGGLFLSYGYLYDNVIDREREDAGIGYMLLHIVLITALNNITAAMEFMRDPEIHEVPKNIFLVASIVIYFVFLFLLERYAIVRVRANRYFFLRLLLLSTVFIVLMALFFRRPGISIAISVLFIYSVFLALFLYGRHIQKSERSRSV